MHSPIHILNTKKKYIKRTTNRKTKLKIHVETIRFRIKNEGYAIIFKVSTIQSSHCFIYNNEEKKNVNDQEVKKMCVLFCVQSILFLYTVAYFVFVALFNALNTHLDSIIFR